MLIFLFDFETTGFDPKIHGICEYGAVVWDTVRRRVVRVGGSLVHDPNVQWEEGAVNTHGIVPELCAQSGMPQDKAFRALSAWANGCDVFAAWNGKQFDFSWWAAWAAKNGTEMPQRLLLDPMVDIQWPKRWSRELFYVAARHHILNHFSHSGVGDALVMTELLARHATGDGPCPVCRADRDLGAILEYAKIPEIWIEGVCSIRDRDLVKTRDFHWWLWPQDNKNDTRKWIKKIRENLLHEEIFKGQEAGYKVARLS